MTSPTSPTRLQAPHASPQSPVDPAALKRAVASAAVQELQSGVRLGVGTGSTVDAFIDALAESGLQPGLLVSSSDRTTQRLAQHGLSCVPLNQLTQPLDLYVDGADELDPSLAMIKGGGAALTREKIVASAARSFLCIVDSSKRVDCLGRFPLPIEFIAMAQAPIEWAIRDLGGEPILRAGCLTDNGHPILDVHGLEIRDPDRWEALLNALPGVVENGVFARHRATTALVGSPTGVDRLKPN